MNGAAAFMKFRVPYDLLRKKLYGGYSLDAAASFILHRAILVILIMRSALKVKYGFIVSTISR